MSDQQISSPEGRESISEKSQRFATQLIGIAKKHEFKFAVVDNNDHFGGFYKNHEDASNMANLKVLLEPGEVLGIEDDKVFKALKERCGVQFLQGEEQFLGITSEGLFTFDKSEALS